MAPKKVTCEPIVVNTRIVVKGGCLGSTTWVPTSTQNIDGLTFVVLNKADRKLALACGFDSRSPHPMGDTGFFEELVSLRNTAVDAYIRGHATTQQVDPLAEEASCSDEVPGLKKLRRTLFEDSQVVLEVDLMGKLMKVLSAVRDDANVWVELTADNLDHIIAALRAHEGRARKRRRGSQQYRFDFPSLGCPDVKWKADRHAVYTTWKDQLGRVAHKFHTPKRSDCDDVYRARVVAAAQELQRAHDENQEPTSG